MTGAVPGAPPLIECVPNFSEGRRPEVLDAIVAAIAAVPGAFVLDASRDASHHRSVVTFVAPPDVVVSAAFAAIREARERIDLRQHRGVHPRIGAADVVPFVPLGGATMRDCVALAHELGQRVGAELDIPVYLYEHAATRPERRNLADVRRGQFEGLEGLIAADPARLPDYGPPRLHPTAGAVAIGARDFLVAYNVYLGGAHQLGVAREVARAVRASSGGLPGVKALALEVDGQAQVSMNLVDLAVTPLHVAHAAVEREARARGADVTWSELIGLVPEAAILATAAERLRLRDFTHQRVLEHRLREHWAPDTVSATLADIGAPTAPPAAGAAAALAGALAAACAQLALSLAPTLHELPERAAALARELHALAADDAAAYSAVRDALARPAADEPRRADALQEALTGAARVPLRIAERCAQVCALAERAAAAGSRHAVSDAGTAALLAEAAARGALYTVRINANGLRDRSAAAELVREAEAHVALAEERAAAARTAAEAVLQR